MKERTAVDGVVEMDQPAAPVFKILKQFTFCRRGKDFIIFGRMTASFSERKSIRDVSLPPNR